MSLIGRIFGWSKPAQREEERAITYQQAAAVGLVSGPTYSGMPVTEQTTLGISAVWCGIRVISEAVGSLPPILYQKTKVGRDVAENHPLSDLLEIPNPEQTRNVLWETAQAHALLYGNAYLEIVRDGAGRPVQLWNLHPTHVQVGRDSDTGTLVYRVQNSATGGPPGAPGGSQILSADDIVHVPGLTPDGSVGYRLLALARDTIGFGLATMRYGNSLFRNLGRPGGVLNIPPGTKLTDDGYENLKRSFRQDHGGENVGSVAVMEQGITFNPFSLATNEQTQYKDLLQFFVYEVARMLNVQPSKLHSLEKATWGNLETLNADFLTTTLRPWLEKWEAEMERKLLMPGERKKYYVEFDTSCLLRVDQKTRYECYAIASGNTAWKTVNEIRAAENLPPVEGGDVLPSTKPEPEAPAEDSADAPNTDQLPDDQGDDNTEETNDE
jgi:HK97 family phage portal protein